MADQDEYSYSMKICFKNTVMTPLNGVFAVTSLYEPVVDLSIKTAYSGPFSRNWLYMSAWQKANYSGNRPLIPMPYKPDMVTVLHMEVEGAQSHWFLGEDITKYRSWSKAEECVVVMSGNIYGGTLIINAIQRPYEIFTHRFYNNYLKLESVHLVPLIPGRVNGVAVDEEVATLDLEFSFPHVMAEFEEEEGVIYPPDPEYAIQKYLAYEKTTIREIMKKKVLSTPEVPMPKKPVCDEPLLYLRDDEYSTQYMQPISIFKNDLLQNDKYENPIDHFVTMDVYGGKLEDMGEYFIFTPNVKPGQYGSFKYRLADVEGNESVNYATVSIYVMQPTLVPLPDQFTTGELEPLDIGANELLHNDKHSNPVSQFIIDEVVGGKLSQTAEGFTFVPSAKEGEPAYFVYRLEDSTGFVSQTSARVTIVLTRPELQPIPEEFDVERASSVAILREVLLANDIHENPIVEIIIEEVIGGRVDYKDGIYTFRPTVDDGEYAAFFYKIKDSKGYVSEESAQVKFNVTAPTLVPKNDHFSVQQDKSIELKFDMLTANDLHKYPIKSVNIVDVVGGTVEKTADGIIFRPSVQAGEYAAFTYTLTDSTGYTSREKATVEFTVTVPVLIPHDDSGFECTQTQSITIPKNTLYRNDEHEFSIKGIIIGDVVGGAVKETADAIIFTPSTIAGESGYFTYKLQDSTDYVSPTSATVTITTTMLPPITGGIFTTAEIEAMFASGYHPPTLAEIFASWARFYSSYYYSAGETPKGEAASWEMNTKDTFRCTVNSNNLTGFVSPDRFSSYSHQADFSSTANDDDCIYLIIAFKRIDGKNHSLLLARHATGNWVSPNAANCFSIVQVINGTGTLIKQAQGTKCKGTGAWRSISPTRVKVVRDGTKIIAQASPFKSLDLNAGERIEIDMKDYPQLAWACEDLPYGYACWSQQYSSFDNVIFDSSAKIDLNIIYNGENGDVWVYNETTKQWVLLHEKVWEVISPIPRVMTNPLTEKSYLITVGDVHPVDGA